jgi:two-component system phosphate regulon sensor histidine kinase PhoR
MEQVEQKLRDIAGLLRSQAEAVLAAPGREAELQPLLARLGPELQVRLTVLDAAGRVLADTEADPATLENHRDRPEIQAAAGPAGVGKAVRESPSLRVPMIYLALPVRRGEQLAGYVRVAAELQSVEAQVQGTQQRLFWLALLFGAVAIGLTWFFVRQILAPVNELTAGAEALLAGNYEHRVTVIGDDELGTLASAFRKMQQDLDRRFRSLDEANQRLTTVLTTMDEGVIAVDSEQRILLANEASRALLEFVTSDVIGRPLLEVTRNLAVHDAVSAALAQPRSVELECEVPGSPRRVLWLTANRFPGKPSPGVVVVLHDVTELRRLENLRREFVTNVSHELKTPLSSISAFAETLRMGAIHDQEHNLSFVIRIQEQAARLHQLILDLIHVARVEAGQESFEIVEVPVRGVVERCVADYRAAAEANQLALTADPPDDPLLVRADEDGLYTILSNLVDNAIKYTPAGGKVEIRWQLEGTQVRIDVADTGIGIPPEHQPRVFERFYRVDKARSRELGGTGLGLSIVKHLAQAFGGSVKLTSQPGRGTTFHVRLPMA